MPALKCGWMLTRRRLFFGSLVLLVLAARAPFIGVAAQGSLPARLSDREFWKLVEDLSEPNGSFRSDNLLSNELQFQYVIPELTRIARPGRAYVGVGPEQNFTYIA